MIKSRLIEVLRTFSNKEFRDLGKWLQSPYHNQRQDVVTLYNFLLENNNLENNKLLSKENAFIKVYPKEKFDDAKMRQVMHFLFKAVENFLVYNESAKDTAKNDVLLARVYRRKKLAKSLKKSIKNAANTLDSQSFREYNYYNEIFLLEEEKYHFLVELKGVRTEVNIQEISNALDTSFLIKKLKIAWLSKAHKAVYKTEYSLGLIDEAVSFVENNDLMNIPAIAVHYFMYKTITESNNEQYYEKLKEQIFQNSSLFPKSELGDIYIMALNYCVGKMNSGNKKFVRETYELYKDGFDKEILIQDNKVSRITFQNVVLSGLRVKEYEWVEKYIEKYQKYLVKEYQESIVKYCLAMLNYEKKDYDKALDLLRFYEHDNVVLTNLNAKTILLKIYYEQDEFKPLESLLESMRAYIQRKKIIGYHKAVYKNILRYTKKLVKINPYNKTQIEKFKKEVELVSPITSSERTWLLQQIERL